MSVLMEVPSPALRQVGINNDTLLGEPQFRVFDYDREEDVRWMQKNWTYSLYAIAIYLSFIYFGRKFMENRKALDLRTPMIVWNLFLAGFSITALVTVFSEAMEVTLGPGGFHRSVCIPWTELSTTGRYFGWLFTLSKIVEFGDTVFLVLRKKPVILLHWYHHITVMLYCWYVYQDQSSTSSWFMIANVFVHSFMYSYYALVAMKVKISRRIAMAITCLQLVQMIVGLIVNGYALHMKHQNIPCPVPTHHIYLCALMYGSYFLLFSKFFLTVYFPSGGRSRKQPTTVKQD